MDLDYQRFDEIDRRLQQIEDRLAQLEGTPANSVVAQTLQNAESSSAESPGEPAAGNDVPYLSLAGKATLILGGAFLLRAATESAALPRQTGVLLGLMYAIAWIVAAAVAAHAGKREAAVFHSAVATIIAYPIIWEGTTRFGMFSAGTAALLLACFSTALILVAHLHDLQSPAWFAAAGATIDALLLAWATKELIPFVLELTFVGVMALVLSMSWVGWLLAVESDLFALVLIIATVMAQSRHRAAAALSLMVFVLAWMTATKRCSAQVAAASLIGIAAGSAFLFDASVTTILWGCAAIASAEISRRFQSPAFALQSVAWGILAAIAGGLFPFLAEGLVETGGPMAALPVPALIAAALCLLAFLRLDFARLPLLGISTCALAAVLIHLALTTFPGEGSGPRALVRTTVLAAIAVTMAAIGRRWRVREASQLAVALLVIAGMKLVMQELIAGRAAIIFMALAVYGSAMLAIARLRRVATNVG